MAEERAKDEQPTAGKVHCTCCPDWEIKRPERCSNTLQYGGRILYFCTRRCKEKFERNPGKYVAAAS